MKSKTTIQTFITNDSLFSTRKYKLEKTGKLNIISLSAFHTKTEIIPLDLINPEPKVEHKPNSYWVFISLVIFSLSIIAFSLSNILTTSLFGALMLLSIAVFIVGLKSKTTTYTFFFANTQTKIFSVNGTQILSSTYETVPDGTDSFISTLKYAIYKINMKHNPLRTKVKSDEDKYKFIKNKLNDLYNYGVIDDILYNRIKESIREKTNTPKLSREAQKSANVIAFEPRKELRDTA